MVCFRAAPKKAPTHHPFCRPAPSVVRGDGSEPLERAERGDIHAHCFELLSPAQIGQVDDEGGADDSGAGPLEELDRGFGGAAGGDQVVDQKDAVWKDRAHCLAVCAKAMRGILVDHARSKGALKRGGERERVPLDSSLALSEHDEVDLLDLEEHLALLATLNERQARLVECRCFSGMTIPEVAEALGVSPRTADEDWAMARAWLSARLARGA